MACIALQSGIIYGPVLSRRLGRSLGINLSPSRRKVCSFDCVYCQYGYTHELILHPMRAMLPKPPEVFEAVEAALKKPRSLDYLTFSGNGEPTIHPDFPEIVRGVKAIKDKLRPETKLAILSNSSRVNDPEVAAALRLFDAPIMKLDAGDEETFEAINRPVDGLNVDEIVGGLKRLPILIVQSVMVAGPVSNIEGSAFENWAERLAELHPRMVQIYSTERPTADSELRCVSPEKLQSIAKTMQDRYHLNAQAYWRD